MLCDPEDQSNAKDRKLKFSKGVYCRQGVFKVFRAKFIFCLISVPLLCGTTSRKDDGYCRSTYKGGMG